MKPRLENGQGRIEPDRGQEWTNLIQKIEADYPDFRLISGAKFAFRPPKTIVVGPAEPGDALLLLHELGHAVLLHRDFRLHVKRLKMEAEAWAKARELAAKYGVKWDANLAEEQLDTYRDWLHNKSRCRECGLTRYQTPDGVYHCPRCENLE